MDIAQLPSLDGLRCFLAAAQFLNFRAASRSVALTPAALGQRIKQLEELVGEELFRRTTRSVTLTPVGLALIPLAREALDAAERCVFAANNDAPPQEITLGTRHELGVSWIVPMLPELESALKHITFHLYFGSGEDLLTKVRMGVIDCGITSTRLSDPKMTSLNMHEEKYVFVGKASLLAKSPLRNAKHAESHVLLDAHRDLPLFRYWADASDSIDAMDFESIRTLGGIAGVKALVLGGAGVAVLPAYFVSKELSRGLLKRILPKVKPRSDHFRLVYRSNDPRSTLFESLARRMRKIPLS